MAVVESPAVAKIMVVDDRAINRQFLAQLLGYAGHQVIEAADGVEALALLQSERPDLTICDILMPRMDGYEFVRRVRSEAGLSASNIIFYTATYLREEAKTLADATGVRHIIIKPSEPEEVLRVVALALKEGGIAEMGMSDERYRARHAELLGETLLARTQELEVASSKLAALIDVGLDLAAERDADRMLERSVSTARRLVPSRIAVAAVLDDARGRIAWFYADGAPGGSILPSLSPRRGVLREMLESKTACRVGELGGDAAKIGLAAGHPPVHSFLGVPLVAGGEAFGWVYLTDRTDLDAFTLEDEKLIATLAVNLAIHFTNLRLGAEIRGHVVRLEREVAERRRAEGELRASDQRTRLATETAAIGIWEWNVLTNDIHWDAQMFRIYGIPKTADGMVVYDDWRSAVLPEDLAEQERILRQTLEVHGRSTREFRIRRRNDGAVRIVQAMETVRLNEAGEVEWVVGTNRDVTEERKAEEEIRRLGKQNQMILDAAGEGIYGLDLEGRTTFINPAAARMLGFAPEELLGVPAHERIHHTRPNGTPFPREECPAFAAVRHGQAHHRVDDLFWRKDGTSFPVEYSSVPIREESGTLIGAVVTFNDISDRVRRQAELEQERRISALGRVAATIGHEFNNVLMGIAPFYEVLRRKAEDPAAVRRAADSIQKAVQRGRAITADILRFTRPPEPSLRPVDISRLLHDTTPEIQNLIGAEVELRVDIRSDGDRVFGDALQLTQVLTNLASNARDAMQGKGRLEIESAASASSIVLRVRDTGCGIPPEILDRIFEPLFTSKRNGTGLGLAVADQVVRRHGGKMSVESRPGEGTTFIIELPKCQ